jgi:hypothetical protein
MLRQSWGGGAVVVLGAALRARGPGRLSRSCGTGVGVMFDGPACRGEDERLGLGRGGGGCARSGRALQQLQRRREAVRGTRSPSQHWAPPLIQSLAITRQNVPEHMDGRNPALYSVVSSWSQRVAACCANVLSVLRDLAAAPPVAATEGTGSERFGPDLYHEFNTLLLLVREA